jgi:hypothetical protein
LARFFTDTNHHTQIVSHDPSRKRFLGKLLGLAAVAGIAPRALAKSTVQAATNDQRQAPIVPKPDARAVARRADSV